MAFREELIKRWKTIYPISYTLKCKGCNKLIKTFKSTAIRCACKEVYFCSKECVTKNSPEHYTCTLKSVNQLTFSLHPAAITPSTMNYMILNDFGSIIVDIKLLYYGYNEETKSVCKVYYLANGLVYFDGKEKAYKIPADEKQLNEMLMYSNKLVQYVNTRNLNKRLINTTLNKLLPDGGFTIGRPEFTIDLYSDKYKIAFMLEYDEDELVQLFKLRSKQDLDDLNKSISHSCVIFESSGFVVHKIKSVNIVGQLSKIIADKHENKDENKSSI